MGETAEPVVVPAAPVAAAAAAAAAVSPPPPPKQDAHGGTADASKMAQLAAAAAAAGGSLEGLLIPPDGAVSLSDKRAPVFEALEKGLSLTERAAPYVFTRGTAGAAAAQALLASRGDALWDEGVHARDNVKITRPAHDAWGVRKAVLVYCDDFMKGAYAFPWFRDPEMRAAVIDPVLRVLGVPEQRVVRALLAAMPPGCDIPIHHDTGFWVKHTHRIHMAVTTCPGKVVFRVGPTPDAMRSALFGEGEVIELNNQAKHAVHNGWDRDRVHLILDYVDDYPLSPTPLLPGAVLAQTRRSIDVLSGAGDGRGAAVPPQEPAFIVIGAQKCGTTSMYEYLNQHPLVLRSRRRETHFFDWRWQQALKTVAQQHAFYMKFFFEPTLKGHPSLVTGESTPSYLLHFDVVIPRLTAVAPHAKLIVMLRDPVKRAYSHYQMTMDTNGTEAQRAARGASAWAGQSFEAAVDGELATLSSAGVTPQTTPEEFARSVLAHAPMGHGGHNMLTRGLYALQLRPWLAAAGDRIKVVVLEDMSPSHDTPEATALQRMMDDVHSHIGLPPSDVINKEAANTRAYEPMGEAVRARLRAFYAPYNSQLAQLLGRDLPWE